MEEFWRLFFAFSWVWIPIIAILVGGFKEWLKFKAKHRELGASASELEQRLKQLEAAHAERERDLTQRIEHLEAIVTTQAWDALHVPEASPDQLLDPLPRPEELSDREKAERLARRVT